MGNSQKLLEASRTGDLDLVLKLLDKVRRNSVGPLSSFRSFANINARDVNGYTPLHHACLNGHVEIVRLLLAHSAAADKLDNRGAMPLFWAAWSGHAQIVQMLLMEPRSVSTLNAQTNESETPLHCAAQHGHTDTVTILLDCGADASIRNANFQTCLDLAAEFGRLEVVKILISTYPKLLSPFKSEKVSVLDNCYMPNSARHTHTCLHLASRNGHQNVVQTLLEAGVDANILTHAGTALHEAAFRGKKMVAIRLLHAGVDPYIKNGNGQTALDLLADYPTALSNEIISVIKDNGKENSKSQMHSSNDENENYEVFVPKYETHLNLNTEKSNTNSPTQGNDLSSAYATSTLKK